MTTMITEAKRAAHEAIVLKHGSHTTFAQGLCAMEAVAWLAGEKHSDRPSCTCPVIASTTWRGG